MQHPSNNIPIVSKHRQREIKWNYLKVCSKLSKITKTLSFTNFAQKIFNVQANPKQGDCDCNVGNCAASI